MTRYELSYQPAPEMMRRAMAAWDKEPATQGRSRWARKSLNWLAAAVAGGGTFALLRWDILANATLYSVAAGLLLSVAIWALVYRASMTKIMRAVDGAMVRMGPVRAVFCAEYVELSSAVFETKMAWLCFDAVTELRDATVLRSGGSVYVIPDAALPEGETPQVFRRDLAQWLEAAR